MSDTLRQQLRSLEEDYPEQPPMVQRSDLEEINRLRAELGMPGVDHRLQPLVGETATTDVDTSEPLEPRPSIAGKQDQGGDTSQVDHTEAETIYNIYMERRARLAPHREYAQQVRTATNSPGQTPVRPLATMGTDGAHCCATSVTNDHPRRRGLSPSHGGCGVEFSWRPGL